MSPVKTAIGLMSGTSMDGIDVALLNTDGESFVKRGPNAFFSYKPDAKELLAEALEDAKPIQKRGERPGCLPEAEALITSLHVDAVENFLTQQNLTIHDIDLLGFHGQTVLHRPDEALTVQIGDGKQLASETGIDTVYDLRANDMFHGGQGAPLIPVYHRALAQNINPELKCDGPVCFVNIGGISNVTFVGDELVAFDTGPGNALIDQWVQKHVGISHDQGGMIAAEGEIDQALVEKYLGDPYFNRPVPKSLDRNDFQIPEETSLSVETVARTLARVSAEAIMNARQHLPEPPNVWIICGGGRHNPHILRDLREIADAEGSKVDTAEEAGLDGDAMEAEGWAYLAVRSSQGLPITYPETTGCDEPVSGGVLAQVPDS